MLWCEGEEGEQRLSTQCLAIWGRPLPGVRNARRPLPGRTQHRMSASAAKGGSLSTPTQQYRRLTSHPTRLTRSRPPPVSGSGRPPSASVDVAHAPSPTCSHRRRVLLGGAALLVNTPLVGTSDAAEAAVGARPPLKLTRSASSNSYALPAAAYLPQHARWRRCGGRATNSRPRPQPYTTNHSPLVSSVGAVEPVAALWPRQRHR